MDKVIQPCKIKDDTIHYNNLNLYWISNYFSKLVCFAELLETKK